MSTLVIIITETKSAVSNVSAHQPGTAPWMEAQVRVSRALKRLLRPVAGRPLRERIALFEEGAIDVCIDIIRGVGKFIDNIVGWAWWIVGEAMTIVTANDPMEYESVRLGVKKGLVELAAWELRFEPLRAGGKNATRAFVALVNTAGHDEFATRVLATNCVQTKCLAWMLEGRVDTQVRRYLLDSSVRTLARLSQSRREAIRTIDGVVQGALAMLPMLQQRDDEILMRIGFNSARLIVRLIDKDDTAKVMQDHPIILDTYGDILCKVLTSGPHRGFRAYGALWNLSGLALDLALLAMSNTTKLSLARFVSPVLDLLAMYSRDDLQLVYHGLVFLSEVSSDLHCMIKLQQCEDRVVRIKAMLESGVVTSIPETLALLNVVVDAVACSQSHKPLPPPRRRNTMLLKLFTSSGGGGMNN